jgi:hypothetical protein
MPPLRFDQVVLVAAAAHKLAVQRIYYLQQVIEKYLVCQLEPTASFFVLHIVSAIPFSQNDYF